MTENTENLVLEILRRMQGDMTAMRREMREEFSEVKARLTLVEVRLSGVERNLADHYTATALQSDRIDRLERRIEHIERRPELRDQS